MRRRVAMAVPALSLALVAGALTARAASAHPTDRPAVTAAPVLRLSIDGANTGTGSDVAPLMTAVLTDVDAYWTRVLRDNGYPEPTVRYAWIPAGESVPNACTTDGTDDTSAFYCSQDDTIYVSERFASAVRDGEIQRWPSGSQVRGSLGDMAVAYAVAHEEAHNIQAELGLLDRVSDTKELELHADCLAGAWAGDAAQRGVVDMTDVKVGEVTAYLIGDFAFESPGHHGTPSERREAFLSGYDDLGSCSQYLAA